MQFTETEKLTVLLSRARTRERAVLQKISAALGNKPYVAALTKRLQEKQAQVMLLEKELRWAKDEERMR